MLRELIVSPRPWQRLAAGLALCLLLANLFWHGAQPYAVNAIAAPFDKLAHLALFAAIAALLVVLTGGRRWGVVLAGCAALAVLDEVMQSMNPGRSVDVTDIAADLIGALLLVALCRAITADDVRSKA